MGEVGARMSGFASLKPRGNEFALLLRVLGLACRVGLWLLIERGLRALGLKTPELAIRLAQRWLRRAAEARLLNEECRTRTEDHTNSMRRKT